ncbi:MAG: VanZ family protein [Bacteroidetes bacterium]|nr:VanZ family protein [Bacteroidota bacterium]
MLAKLFNRSNFYTTLLWAMLILVLCLMPGKELPKIWWLELLSFDKVVHAAVFAILTILFIRNLEVLNPTHPIFKNRILTAIAISSCYGGALEVMQGTLIEGRSADIYDFVFDALGCFLGVWVARKKKWMLFS